MTGNNFYFEPSVIEKTPYGERSYDVYSRLLKDRVVFLRGEVNEALADAPGLINESPEDKGWLCRLTNFDSSELDDMMNEDAYQKYLRKLRR